MDFHCQLSGMKPARQVITRAPHRTVGAIHAPWLQTDPIHHESDLEAAAVKLLLLAPAVQGIHHQAVKLTYFDGIKDRTHVPDLKVVLRNQGYALIEVKPAKFVDGHRVKFDACAGLLARQGVDYFVCTDQHANKTRTARASELLHLARMAAPADQLLKLVTWVREHDRITVRAAISQGHAQVLLGHAVGRRLLYTDPSLDLDPESWLFTQETVNEHFSLSDWLGCSPWPSSRPPASAP